MSKTVTLGDRLKQIREERGLSKSQMAGLLKIGRVTYGNYENGNRHPDSTIIPDLCKGLGVTSDYLLGMSDTRLPKYAKVAETTGLDENAILYLSRIRNSTYSGNVDIINLLLNDEPDVSSFDDDFLSAPVPLSDSEIEQQHAEYLAWCEHQSEKPILEALSEEWRCNDHFSEMSEEEITAHSLEDRAEMEASIASLPVPTTEEIMRGMSEINSQQALFEREWKKSNLLSRISEFLSYHEGCCLCTSGQEEPLSDDHQICLGIGNKYMNFPSKESNELFEFMLIQRIIESLKIFKKNFNEARR